MNKEEYSMSRENLTNNTLVDREYMNADRACPFQCKYCFAKWKMKLPKTVDIHEGSHTVVLYPLCDSELCSQDIHELEHIIQEYIKNNLNDKKLIVSISTKDKEFTNYIPILNRIQKTVSLTGGFVKLGISFTNINYEYLEEGTATFEERINLLRMLSEYEFKLSAVIKPLLPFVTLDEYKEIIKQSDVDKYLLGGLYVEEGSEFYNLYIKGKFKVTHRPVAWLNDEKYLYVESDETQTELIHFIKSIGKNAYSSDIEMIKSWL